MGIITSCPYTSAPNIMDTPDYKTKVVKLDFNGTDCIKAGSPISADGKVANDATAIGILLDDCHACLGNRRGLVVIDGRIKQDVAAAHSGITISDKAKAALVNISFTGDGERMGGGSSGGEKPFFTGIADPDMSEENLISGFNYGGTEKRAYYPLVKLSDGEVAKFIDLYENEHDAVSGTTVMIEGILLKCTGFGRVTPDAPLIFNYKGFRIETVNTDAFSSVTYPANVFLLVASLQIYLTGENKGKSIVCVESVELQVKTE